MGSAFLRCLAAISMLFVAIASKGDVLEGRVVAVHDGDTISILVDKTEIKIRIAEIDTPESDQPWAARAKKALAARVFGKDVRVIEVDVDPYDRIVGEVYADDVCVGCELVREGHAWVYREYSDDEVLLQLEEEARAKGMGLWGLPESQRVPPWEWRRKGHRGGDAERPAQPNLKCGSKNYCREMASCDEARFHLEQCGVSRLDGDGDGVPCEPICGRN